MKQKNIDARSNVLNNKLRKWFSWFNFAHFFNVLLSVFLISAVTVLLFRWQINQRLKEAEAAMDTIYAFMATATEEEYGEIAEEIRHSLILRTLNEEDLKYLDLIPNTAEHCPLDQELDGGIYLVALNTGELYDLSAEQPAFGYDEVSRSRIEIERGGDGQTNVALLREEGEVSVQRMKGCFCEDCFQSLVETLTGKSVLEFALFDAGTHTLYPIMESDGYSAGGCTVSVSRNVERGWNDYDLRINSGE